MHLAGNDLGIELIPIPLTEDKDYDYAYLRDAFYELQSMQNDDKSNRLQIEGMPSLDKLFFKVKRLDNAEHLYDVLTKIRAFWISLLDGKTKYDGEIDYGTLDQGDRSTNAYDRLPHMRAKKDRYTDNRRIVSI